MCTYLGTFVFVRSTCSGHFWTHLCPDLCTPVYAHRLSLCFSLKVITMSLSELYRINFLLCVSFPLHSCFVGLPGVLSVRPDPDFSTTEKDYSIPDVQLGLSSNIIPESTLLFPMGNSKPWVVRLDKPAIGVVTKAWMVDYYAQLLTKVMGK